MANTYKTSINRIRKKKRNKNGGQLSALFFKKGKKYQI